MSNLNRNWQISTLAAIVARTDGTGVTNLQKRIAEVDDLVQKGLVNDDSLDTDTNYNLVSAPSRGLTWANVAEILGDSASTELLKQGFVPTALVYPHLGEAVAAPVIPAPVAETAPAAPVAPVAPAVQYSESPAPVAPAAPTTAIPAAPTFAGQSSAPVATASTPAATEVVDVASLPAVEAGAAVELRGKTYTVDTGVTYQAPAQGFTKGNNPAKNNTAPTYPFDEIAAMKIREPNTQPSFVVHDKKPEKLSTTVRSNGMRWEEKAIAGMADDVRVTFRSMPEGEEGTRVFALFVSEAPKRRQVKKKAKADGQA